MVTSKEIVSEFEKVLKKLDWDDSFGDWARKITDHFCKAGARRGYSFCTDLKSKRKSEKRQLKHADTVYKIKIGKKWMGTDGQYLVDFCWYEMDPKYQTVLAMEIEWHPLIEDVDWDFYKLMDVKAPMKVWISFVAEKHLESEFKKLVKKLGRMKIRIPGEKFLIILLTRPTGNKRHPTAHYHEVYVTKR